MLKNNNKFKKGFTIIEVVLVLAIAGLIFLMVFIALPALQSSQRNTQREDDLSRFLTAITDYSTNNSGRIPFSTGTNAEAKGFVKKYIDDTCSKDLLSTDAAFECTADQFRDPDGELYSFAEATVDGSVDAEGNANVKFGSNDGSVEHKVYHLVGYTCGTLEGTAIKGTGNRQVALYMVLEGGGVSCNANS